MVLKVLTVCLSGVCFLMYTEASGVLGVVALFCLLEAFSFLFKNKLSNCCEFQAGAFTYCKPHVDKTGCLKSHADFLLHVTRGSGPAKTKSLKLHLVG